MPTLFIFLGGVLAALGEGRKFAEGPSGWRSTLRVARCFGEPVPLLSRQLEMVYRMAYNPMDFVDYENKQDTDVFGYTIPLEDQIEKVKTEWRNNCTRRKIRRGIDVVEVVY